MGAPVFQGMSPTPSPREPTPFAPCLTLNLRDDPIPAGYSRSTHTADNSPDDDDKDEQLYMDNNTDIQEADIDRCVFLVPFLLLVDVTRIASMTSLRLQPSLSNEHALPMNYFWRSQKCRRYMRARGTPKQKTMTM